jgi:hypothetical protein
MAKYVKAIYCADTISKVFGIPLANLVDTFAEIPAAKVEEVVHCKDCGYCEQFYPEKRIGEEARETYYCRLLKGDRYPHDFCSFGKRKEDDK